MTRAERPPRRQAERGDQSNRAPRRGAPLPLSHRPPGLTSLQREHAGTQTCPQHRKGLPRQVQRFRLGAPRVRSRAEAAVSCCGSERVEIGSVALAPLMAGVHGFPPPSLPTYVTQVPCPSASLSRWTRSLLPVASWGGRHGSSSDSHSRLHSAAPSGARLRLPVDCLRPVRCNSRLRERSGLLDDLRGRGAELGFDRCSHRGMAPTAAHRWRTPGVTRLGTAVTRIGAAARAAARPPCPSPWVQPSSARLRVIEGERINSRHGRRMTMSASGVARTRSVRGTAGLR